MALAEGVVNLGDHGQQFIACNRHPEADRIEPMPKKTRLGQQRQHQVRTRPKSCRGEFLAGPERAGSRAARSPVIGVVPGKQVEPVARQKPGNPHRARGEKQIVGIMAEVVADRTASCMADARTHVEDLSGGKACSKRHGTALWGTSCRAMRTALAKPSS